MKKLSIIILAIICLMPLFVNAQTKKVKETFNEDDKVHFDWEEYVDKKGGVEIKEGCLLLTNKEKNSSRMVFVNLPIDVEKNFKITAAIIVPNLNDKEYFGITIDNTEKDFTKQAFFIQEGWLKFAVIQNDVEGNEYDEIEASNQRYITLYREFKRIKLKGGKNQTVNAVIEKKGKKLIFSINNMQVYEIYHKAADFLTAPCLGFIVNGNNSLKIDEIVIEQ